MGPRRETCSRLAVALLLRALGGAPRICPRGAEVLDVRLVLLTLERALEIARNVEHLRRLREALVEAEAHRRRSRVLVRQDRGRHRRLLPGAVGHGQRHLRDRLRLVRFGIVPRGARSGRGPRQEQGGTQEERPMCHMHAIHAQPREKKRKEVKNRMRAPARVLGALCVLACVGSAAADLTARLVDDSDHLANIVGATETESLVDSRLKKV